MMQMNLTKCSVLYTIKPTPDFMRYCKAENLILPNPRYFCFETRNWVNDAETLTIGQQGEMSGSYKARCETSSCLLTRSFAPSQVPKYRNGNRWRRFEESPS
ncbi:hypothetical protein HN011_004037 [Eciton burchellii]|nr:hypothetical protein HN011_004037 [Eciton burchellii]